MHSIHFQMQYGYSNNNLKHVNNKVSKVSNLEVRDNVDNRPFSSMLYCILELDPPTDNEKNTVSYSQ